ncbi:hypothetical protein [Mesorhizobium neociceri]|uniref:Uncharacterized protein n=1 Tax=Mesorhizobium neociceri TaxID=1307853 RepID=A0A838BDZ8_9HYPH|nr:hypothetical protein [Mesorhizobium neociceri]MBA1144776.1 hypothetical protein [Mesorhizobium neociceri]
MVEILDFELDSARLRVKRAENSLTRAREEMDRENGAAVNLSLCCRILAAQKRVTEARQRHSLICPREESSK